MKLNKHLVMAPLLFSSANHLRWSSCQAEGSNQQSTLVLQCSGFQVCGLQHNKNHERDAQWHLCISWAVASAQLQPAWAVGEESCCWWQEAQEEQVCHKSWDLLGWREASLPLLILR